MEKFNLKEIKYQAKEEIGKAVELKDLDGIFKKYLGKKGKLTEVFRSLKDLKEKERIEVGKEANRVRKFIEEEIEKKSPASIKISKHKGNKEIFDITVPGEKLSIGHLHPLTIAKRKIEEIFNSMGFSIVEGPEVESEWYNFDALNIPKDHPARDMWDTFYLENGLLLRTHTSPNQIRYLEKNNPPLRIVVPGRVFRHEATDASHEVQFYQLEGLMVGKDVSVANFKAIIEKFLAEFFNKNIKIRLRPSYFPFTEPSFEVDMSCLACGGKGCSACQGTGWIEIIGAGMVHPNVLKSAGLLPHKLSPRQGRESGWQGFAFGVGVDRLTMMKYKINDIRLFYSGDLRFLSQF